MRRLKVGIDLRCVVYGEAGGLTQWVHGTLAAAFGRDPRHTYVLFTTPFNYHLFADPPANVVRHTLPPRDYYDRLQDRVAYEADYDVLFRAHPLGVLDRFPLARQVTCIPDCQHEVYPEYFAPDVLRQRRVAYRAFQAAGGAIATLTEFSRAELLADPWTATRDVFLMPPGVPAGLASGGDLSAAERALVPTRPFFLYAANLWPHKNHARVLEAFRLFHRTHPEYELILTGHPAGWERFGDACRGLPVRHLGYVRPGLLGELQRRAVAVAHLSLYEGFGIPLLEAFAAGTPVVCGDRTAMPEVAGGAAELCDPTSAEDLAAALARVADDPARRDRLRESGRRRLAAFSWDRAADALLAAFERVASRAGRPTIRVYTPPTVSIVTPSFNQGAFIRETIDSVLAQDYPHVDYRVVDGGSTDETVAILKGFGDRVKWVSEKDRGQTHAINKGMAAATGEVLTYLNSDDLLRPGAVSRVVAHLRDNPRCDLVYGRDALIDARGEYLGMYPTREYAFDRLKEQCCVSQPAAFWRRRLAEQVGPFDESLYLVMDYDYWLRADRAGGVLEHLPEVLANTRIHRQAKSSGEGVALSHRRLFYRELFSVQRRHAGGVSDTYAHGWVREMVLTPRPWARRFEERITRACLQRPAVRRSWQNWYHLRYDCGAGPWRSAAAILAAEGRVFAGKLWRKALRPLGWFRRPPPPAPRVDLGRDLWLGPVVTFPHPGGPLRLAGVPARDTVLRVYRGADEVAAVPLPGDRPADLCVQVPPGPPADPVRVVFDAAEPLPDGRVVAFRLRGTTLFGERDVA